MANDSGDEGKTGDNTESNTRDLEDPTHEVESTPDRLLGPALVRPHESGVHVLFRLRSGSLEGALAQRFGSQYSKPQLSQKKPAPAMVLGPISIEEARELAKSKDLTMGDHMIRSFDRWKTVRTEFPDLSTAFSGLDDVTATATASIGGGSFGETDAPAAPADEAGLPAPGSLLPEDSSRILSPAPSSLEEVTPSPSLDDIDPKLLEIDEVPSVSTDTQAELNLMIEEDIPVTPKARTASTLEVESPETPESPDPSPAGNSPVSPPQSPVVSGPVRPAAPSFDASKARAPSSPHNLPPLVNVNARSNPNLQIRTKAPPPFPLKSVMTAAVVLLSIAGVTIGMKQGAGRNVLPTTTSPVANDLQAPKPVLEWPEDLKELSSDTLFSQDDAVVKKIRPILSSYEKGNTRFSVSDLETLKSYSQAGTSSWEARRLAANQLAVHFVSAQKSNEAKAILSPIYEGSSSDPTTLMNLSLIHLVEGDSKAARQIGEIALRLSPSDLRWMASTILGMIDGSSGAKAEDLEKNFSKALESSTNNPFVYGVWIQQLIKVDPKGKGKIPELIREALWADPDRLLDSPIPAPLAGHIVLAESLDGLSKAYDWSDSKLKPGQIAFGRWLVDARSRSNPVSQPLSQVTDILATEDDLLSQMLYAYTLEEVGRIDEASEVLSRLLALVDKDRKFQSSWPWSFAGDLQFARGRFDQALLHYQAALDRNHSDASALVGLALTFREKGSFPEARQKLKEALAQDPAFIPARLRMTRLRWHHPFSSK